MKQVPEGHNPHLPRGINDPWHIPKLYAGRVVFIIGGGPSLRTFDLSPLKDQICIAVNNAFKIAPWAAHLHFADAIWWQWNRLEVRRQWTKPISTATSDVGIVPLHEQGIHRLWRDRNRFTREPYQVHGWDSGTQALNIAYHFGVRKAVLVGFDMQAASDGATQWHNEHKRPTAVENYEKRFKPGLHNVIRGMAEDGIPVVRITNPGSPEAPLVSFSEAIA